MKKILIVEDDKKIIAALTVRLKAAGYEVLTALDAVMAMRVALKNEPDLVLLDISMPGGNGFMVAERLQNSTVTVGVPMIFLTASKQPEMRQKAMELGAAAFFEKPYEAEALLTAIRQALGDPVSK
ncbi:MAG TPA: response regulator [Candidatus Tectomicrobia bacterium]|jgi:DNA-binding response OmpR family regulator